MLQKEAYLKEFGKPYVIPLQKIQSFKGGLQILGQNIYINTKKSSLYSQSLLFFIHKTPVVESHPTTSKIRDLLRPRSTPTRNTVYSFTH